MRISFFTFQIALLIKATFVITTPIISYIILQITITILNSAIITIKFTIITFIAIITVAFAAIIKYFYYFHYYYQNWNSDFDGEQHF